MNPSWTPLEPAINSFLDEFDERGADPNGGSEGLFAPTFLALDPTYAVSLTPEQLAATLPGRRAMFGSAGVGEVRRREACQLRLDDQHVLVAGDWTAEREGTTSLQLSSTLLLRSEPDGYRILVYLNHQDITALLAGP
jgi:hypothetical protein